MLDRVIAFGHTWSPTLELTPPVPLRHGHAINIMSRVGLTLDHELFEIELIWKATKSIMLTRDGLQRAAMPSPIGQCIFLNDLTYEELKQDLKEHKELVKNFPRAGDGLDAYVDPNDYMEENNTDGDDVILTKKSDGELIVDAVSSSMASSLAIEMNSMAKQKGYCAAVM
jgi:3-dehydroquinate synthase